MPLQQVEPRRLYRQIAEQITGLIASGEFPPGSRLPAERELAAKLGVSRASVREAIISLEIGGLVDVRVGTGIFVDPGLPIRLIDDLTVWLADQGFSSFESSPLEMPKNHLLMRLLCATDGQEEPQ